MNCDRRRAALAAWLKPCPLIAILRGLDPAAATAIGNALVGAGLRLIEVPLNSPRPLESIRALAALPGVVAGAGTVLNEAEVAAVAEAGARFVVAPNFEARVVAAAAALGLPALPGVATPTEAFAALAAGAAGLKLFPAEALPPAVVKAWRAVLPADTLVLPVGGITPASLAPYRAAGADGFGLGSALFAPGTAPEEVAARARAFVASLAV